MLRVAAGVLMLWACTVLGACTQPLPIPPPPPLPGDAGPALAPGPLPDCAATPQVATDLLRTRCGSCHGDNMPPADLDLVTTGVQQRLLAGLSTECAGKRLVVPGPPVGGHFFDKLAGPVPGCGVQEPFGSPPLSPDEIRCLQKWLAPAP
jgi:hypothetical protein